MNNSRSSTRKKEILKNHSLKTAFDKLCQKAQTRLRLYFEICQAYNTDGSQDNHVKRNKRDRKR